MAAGRKKEASAMVTAMEDANGVREEDQEAAPQGQPGVEVAPAVQSIPGADASGGEATHMEHRLGL